MENRPSFLKRWAYRILGMIFGPPMTAVCRELLSVNEESNLSSLKNKKNRVLLLLPSSAQGNSESLFLGSTKDILSRQEYFKDRNRTFDVIYLPKKPLFHPKSILFLGREYVDFKQYDFIIIDLPGSHALLAKHLRKTSGGSKIIFRSHNAEFFHRLDWAKATSSIRKKISYFFQALWRWWGDFKILQICDYVLPIASWDEHFYWVKMAHTEGLLRKIVLVPYFMPKSLIEENPPSLKLNNVVCMGYKGKANPILETGLRQYLKSISDLPMEVRERWTFQMTGELPNDFNHEQVETLGFLETPFSALYQARAVCVLSDLGRGFKTKIMDALVAKCFLLVHESLYYRLPVEIMPFCYPFNPENPKAFEKALADLDGRKFPEDFEINAHFRQVAFRALDSIFKT